MKNQFPLGALAAMAGTLGLTTFGGTPIYTPRCCLQIPRDDGPEIRALHDKMEAGRKASAAEAIRKAAEKRARKAARKGAA